MLLNLTSGDNFVYNDVLYKLVKFTPGAASCRAYMFLRVGTWQPYKTPFLVNLPLDAAVKKVRINVQAY